MKTTIYLVCEQIVLLCINKQKKNPKHNTFQKRNYYFINKAFAVI